MRRVAPAAQDRSLLPGWGWLLAAAAVIGGIAWTALPRPSPATVFHYAPNHNFAGARYLPAQAGFNLADVSDPGQLASLPPGVKGLVWVGQCGGVTSHFLAVVSPFVGRPNLFGFYLMDAPDPRPVAALNSNAAPCTTERLNAEADWIHAHVKGAKTFMVLMNLGTSKNPSFPHAYDPARLRVDLFGLDPYPCRSEYTGCDYAMINRYVAAAEANGVPRRRMIPIFQTFGGGTWKDDGGGAYLLPAAAQEEQILSRWRQLVAAPVFDYAYSWGGQNADSSLETAADLRALFTTHNTPSAR